MADWHRHIDINTIRSTAARIERYVHQTPVMTSRTLDEMSGRRLFFKCENLQRVGAFKFRGAMNAVLQLADDIAPRGVVTHSSGNHAQALALAARTRGIPAHIVMPRTAPQIKVDAVRGYGADITFCEPTETARHDTADRVQRETGGTLIPPFDHPHIIAGQGTAALELLADVPDLNALITPIGGGGLMSGTGIAAHGLHHDVAVFGAEPAGADDAARSLAAGQRILQTAPDTIADGLLTSLSEATFAIIQQHVRTIFTVPDDAIRDAMRLVLTRMKLVIEPSAAVPVAAVLSEDFQSQTSHRRIGIILSGGNLDPDC